MYKKYRVGIAGATGLVGRTMMKVLEERNFPLSELRLFASENSEGKTMTFGSEYINVEKLTLNSFAGLDFCLFSAGSEASKIFAPECAKYKCIAIDNSSAWRMDPNVPLIVPEVNPADLSWHQNIIANPNCSTIQLVVALKPIQTEYGLKRIVCSTYQSITGAGQKGLNKLQDELYGSNSGEMRRIAFNWMFHPIEEDFGFSIEEMKMINETRKIMGDDSLRIAVTCVRLPVVGAHGESVNIETNLPFELLDVRQLMKNSNGIELIDEPHKLNYATPDFAKDRDEVFVSRLRRDATVDNGFYMWVTSDNLRKGAATNAVQIVEKIIELGLK